MSPSTPLHTVLSAVQLHPHAMSPMLLEHLLRGEPLGRMAEKGLLDSPHFGTLAALEAPLVAAAIQQACDAGLVQRGGGFYPALGITHAGEDQLRLWVADNVSSRASDGSYQAYYRWRQALARRMRKPPYRILCNATLVELARFQPTTLEALLSVPGLGKRRALRYQDDLLAVGAALRAEAAPAPASL